jgi:hypothetical protein
MPEDDPIQRSREQRLVTLTLADQIASARWDEPALPGAGSLHMLLSHLLGWDEWLIAALEVSGVRELPTRLIDAYRDVDGFNARSISRLAHISRDDLMASLQGSSMRVASSALAIGGTEWARRRIAELAPPRTDALADAPPSRGPTVGGLLRLMRAHEQEHGEEISATFGVRVDLEQLRADLTGEPRAPGQA